MTTDEDTSTTAATKSIGIEADAKLHVELTYHHPGKAAESLQKFESSRNLTVLIPKLSHAITEAIGALLNRTECQEANDTEDTIAARLHVSGTVFGVIPDTGEKASMVLYDAPASDVMQLLNGKMITPEEAMIASRGFFGDMLDMVDVKLILMTAVFDKGQAGYVMLNKTVEVEPKHMYGLIAGTLMQLDKFKAQMQAAGVPMPDEAPGILKPGDVGFSNVLSAMAQPSKR